MPLSFPSSYFLLSPAVTAVITLFACLLPTPFSQDVTYAICDRTFSCGSLRDISYPFTGGDRPDHCGPPDFRLQCRNNHTELTTDSTTYRVLGIDQIRRTMVVARLDLWNNTCPAQFLNTTLDLSVFNPGIGNQDLNLIYGCNASGMTVRPQNLFTCNSRIFNFSNAYYLLGEVPSDPILGFIYCTVAVRVPVLRTAAEMLSVNRTTLENALMEGFNLNYSNPFANQCSQCTQFGGQCGFDSDSRQPICICGDRLCPLPPSPPPPPPAGSGNNNQISLGLAFGLGGAVFAGVGIGWLIFFYRQRRKRRSAGQTGTKDVQTPPPPPPAAASSKGLSSSSSSSFIHFNRSIPSYASSKSEFGNSTYYGVPVFSYAELEEATDNFDSSRELGDGGFGTVYYGKLNDGRVVAVKRLYENNFKRKEQFMNEIEILTRLRHRNLVALFGCTSKRSHELLLVYEFIPNGTVADHVHGKLSNSGLLSWPVRLNIAIETAGALSYLHASDIIHRDVKTNNILLDNDFHVKVADFGLSRLFPTDVTHVSTAPQGTPGYVDPEYYRCYQLTEKSDVYSFGVFLIELVSSLPAVDTNRHRHEINLSNMAINKIQNHGLHELVDPKLGFGTDDWVRRTVTAVAELAFRCLQPEKDTRPSMEEVAAGLRGIQNEKVNDQEFDVVDILDDDVALLKSNSLPPLLLESMAVGDN